MFSESRTHNYHLIRQGAGNAVANGMSYTGAIMALTSNVAKSFNITDRGILKKGMKADIVVWEDDPLEPSTFPMKVFIDGNDMDLTTRSSRLTERYVDKRDLPTNRNVVTKTPCFNSYRNIAKSNVEIDGTTHSNTLAVAAHAVNKNFGSLIQQVFSQAA